MEFQRGENFEGGERCKPTNYTIENICIFVSRFLVKFSRFNLYHLNENNLSLKGFVTQIQI